MTQSQQPAYMGEFLRHYKPPLLSLNTAINFVTTKPSKFVPSVAITPEVQFPDVSFYQREVDYSIMTLHTDAIIIRAGQNTWVDEQFEYNYQEATSTRLLKGIYWFYDGRSSPADQANLLISLLRGKHVEMEVFIDWERNYGGRWEGLQNVVAMMQVVERAGLDIKDVGLYTGYYFFRSNSNSITHANQYNYLKNKPLWLAWYTSNPVNVLIPAPWTSLTHWQFGTPVVFWGQQTSELDMNFFNGWISEFQERYGGTSTPPPTGEPMSFKITPDRSIGSKIRKDPNISSTQLGSLTFGRFGYGIQRWTSEPLEDWIRITEYENAQGVRVALDGWIASKSGGVQVATIIEVTDMSIHLPHLMSMYFTSRMESQGSSFLSEYFLLGENKFVLENNTLPEPDRLPAGRKFGRLIHDYELYGVSRPTHNNASKSTAGLPETIKVIFPLFMDMTEAWQWFWVDVFSLSKYGKLYLELSIMERGIIRTAFKSTTAGYRAFTNGTGWNNGYANYVNNINTDADPMRQETIITAGNVVELLSEKMRIGGKDAYKVRTLDGTLSPPNPLTVNSQVTPWLVFKATISKRDGYNDDTGRWRREDIVTPFYQLDGADVPIPFMADKSENYIEAERIQILPDNAIVPNPYH